MIDDLGRQLLAADELPAGWQLDGVSEYSAGEPEEEIVEVCPAAESLNVIDLALRWEAEFSGPSDRRAAQLLGQMADEGIAAATVRQFAEVGSCDLDVMIPESVSSGGLVDVDGADAAATLFIEAESEGSESNWEQLPSDRPLPFSHSKAPGVPTRSAPSCSS